MSGKIVPFKPPRKEAITPAWVDHLPRVLKMYAAHPRLPGLGPRSIRSLAVVLLDTKRHPHLVHLVNSAFVWMLLKSKPRDILRMLAGRFTVASASRGRR